MPVVRSVQLIEDPEIKRYRVGKIRACWDSRYSEDVPNLQRIADRRLLTPSDSKRATIPNVSARPQSFEDKSAIFIISDWFMPNPPDTDPCSLGTTDSCERKIPECIDAQII